MNQSQKMTSKTATATATAKSRRSWVRPWISCSGVSMVGSSTHSVYADSSSRYRDLDRALVAIKAAMEVMRQTNWPTDARFRAVDPLGWTTV